MGGCTATIIPLLKERAEGEETARKGICEVPHAMLRS